MASAPVTFDVWAGGARPPVATDVRDGVGPAPRGATTPRRTGGAALVVAVLGAVLLGVAAAFVVFLLAPGLHPAVAPEVTPTDAAVATLSPDQLERLTVRVGDDEWVMVRRPHQGPR